MLDGQGGDYGRGHDDLNPERNQVGRERGEPLEPSLRISVLNHEIATLDVPEVTESLKEGLLHVETSRQVGSQVAYSSDLGRLLGLGSERRRHEADEESDGECRANDHHAATAPWWLSPAVLVEIMCPPVGR